MKQNERVGLPLLDSINEAIQHHFPPEIFGDYYIWFRGFIPAQNVSYVTGFAIGWPVKNGRVVNGLLEHDGKIEDKPYLVATTKYVHEYQPGETFSVDGATLYIDALRTAEGLAKAIFHAGVSLDRLKEYVSPNDHKS